MCSNDVAVHSQSFRVRFLSMKALEVKSLWKNYGKAEVVRGLELTVNPGEIYGLLGPNGAGKSTTINMITGIVKIDRGSIHVFGADNQVDVLEAKRRIGVMPQELVADNFFDIGTSLRLQCGYYGVKFDKTWHDEVVGVLDLKPHLAKRVIQLSGGMKRRFLMAKALMHQPKLLILDEPTAGVDVELRRAIWDFVRRLNKEYKLTILLTTHYLDEAEEMCHRIGFIQKGQIIREGSPKELMSSIHERIIKVQTAQPIDGETELTIQTRHDQIQQSLTSFFEKLPVSNEVTDIKILHPDLEDVFINLMGSKSV